jgi:enediyne biosynthesis protein E4
MGYVSASDPHIHFGLGKNTRIQSLEVTWQSRRGDHLSNLPVDEFIAIHEGTRIVPGKFPKIVSAK